VGRKSGLILSVAMRWVLILLLCILEALAQRPRLSRKPASAPASSDDTDLKTISIKGVITGLDEKQLVLDAVDHRILAIKLTKQTHIPPGALAVGDHVRIEATQDQEAFLTATEVTLERTAEKPVTSSDPSPDSTVVTATKAPEPSRPVVYKPAKPDPEDEGPPRLRHGQPNPKPARSLAAEDEPAQTATAEAAPAESVKETRAVESVAELKPGKSAEAPLIERAREWALSFTSTLPNYVCQQFTTRYLKNPGQRDWQAKDIVSANVVYEHGKEDYRNIAINGKAQSKKMEELPGSWSTGEFGTTLRSLFHPSRRAVFKYVKQTQITGMTASVYDYSVKREYSDWRIQLGSQAIIPAYSGRVWIDQKTARVIRIEMQAEEIPQEFPLDKVESTNDYGLIRLATADQFMLPVHAETLSCERNSTFCSRNAIEFRNYHKYSGEANISFQ